MQNEPTKMPSKLGMLKLAIPFVIALVVLVLYNFKSINAYQHLANEIEQGMFEDSSLSAVLLTFRDNQDIKEVTINVNGVKGEFAEYRAEIIQFVCKSEVLREILDSSERVDLKVSASLRKHDKYLDISVTQQNCLSLG